MPGRSDARPLVSVIVPSHDVERHIRATLESVRAQTMPDWEAIVSDDGSTDRTAEIARSVASEDPRVRVIAGPAARHAGVARNRALAAARGDYVAFLDSDDLWLPEKLERQLSAMRATRDPGVCYTGSEAFDDGDAPFRRSFPDTPPPPTREAQYAALLLRGDNYNTSSFVLERAFADEIGPFSESPRLRSGQDTDYLLRATWRRPLLRVPEVLCRVRDRAGSLSALHGRNWERYLAIFEAAEERGEMPPELRSRCLSIVRTVQGEALLRDGAPGWRAAFLRALALDPTNPRRWPCAAALALPRGAMRAFYEGLRSRARG